MFVEHIQNELIMSCPEDMNGSPQARCQGPLQTNLSLTHSPKLLVGILDMAKVRVGGYQGVLGRGPAASLRPWRSNFLVGSASKERAWPRSPFWGSSRRDAACSEEANRTVFVGNLEARVREDSLRAVPSGTVGREGISEGGARRAGSAAGGAGAPEPPGVRLPFPPHPLLWF